MIGSGRMVDLYRFRRLLYERSGLVLWLLSITTALAIAALKPQIHSVLPAYEFGAAMFSSERPLYDLNTAMGYVYAPAFAVLYAPFAALGSHVGGILWRLLGVCALTVAMIKQARVIDKSNAMALASTAFFLAIPMSLGAIRNGQATVLFTAACWMLILSARDNCRAATVAWALVALVAKPTAIVVILLTGAIRPRLIPFLVFAIALAFAIPYAFASIEYVNEQHLEFFRLLTSMSANSSGTFEAADFTAPFTALNISLSANVTITLRAVAAGVVLLTSLWLDHRGDRQLRSFVIFLLAAYYMTVFNPRVESNTYLTLVVPTALAISLMKIRCENWRVPLVPGAAIFLCGWTGVSHNLHSALNPWFKPAAMSLIALPICHWLIRQSTEPSSSSLSDTRTEPQNAAL